MTHSGFTVFMEWRWESPSVSSLLLRASPEKTSWASQVTPEWCQPGHFQGWEQELPTGIVFILAILPDLQWETQNRGAWEAGFIICVHPPLSGEKTEAEKLAMTSFCPTPRPRLSSTNGDEVSTREVQLVQEYIGCPNSSNSHPLPGCY